MNRFKKIGFRLFPTHTYGILRLRFSSFVRSYPRVGGGLGCADLPTYLFVQVSRAPGKCSRGEDLVTVYIYITGEQRRDTSMLAMISYSTRIST